MTVLTSSRHAGRSGTRTPLLDFSPADLRSYATAYSPTNVRIAVIPLRTAYLDCASSAAEAQSE